MSAELEQAVKTAATEYRERMRGTREGAEGCTSETLERTIGEISDTHGVEPAMVHELFCRALWA